MNVKLESLEDKILQEDLNIIADSNLPWDKIDNAAIFITGATGLIGASLVRALLCASRKNDMNIKILAAVRNIEKAKKIYGYLLEREELQLIVGDITEKFDVKCDVDYIFHCASVTASKVMVEQPVETLTTAILGTKNILDLAIEKKVKSFVYVSSMEMYGSFNSLNCLVSESDLGYINPLNVRSNYPESKRVCENMCIAYMSEYDVPVKIARLAQTFGAGILPDENRVFAQFARSAMNGEDIVLHTEGKSEGNYCYTRDTVTGLITILIKGSNGEAYNVTNPDTHTSIGDMAKMVSEQLTNGKIKVVFDIPESNKYGYAADTKMKLSSDKLQSLGWKPKVGLLEAYKRLIASLTELKK
jgi:nucleoside-diphosphate-sugar epimerase